MRITLLVDNPKSWFLPYARTLRERLKKQGHQTALVHQAQKVAKGDCLFLLSCGRVVGKEILSRNTHNIVIHASKLPQGRGFAPLTWQILKGKNIIWITLFEAVEKVDSGSVYFQETIRFDGHELNDELRAREGEKVVELALKFVKQYPLLKGRQQTGKHIWYRKRTPEDSELDISKSIQEQFNLLRVVDNERYPAFFKYKKHTYVVKIYKQDP